MGIDELVPAMASAVCGGSSEEKGKRQGRGAWRPFGWPRRMPAVLPGSVARWILLVTVLLASLASSAEPPSRSRAAGGRGPELRSRVTQALEKLALVLAKLDTHLVQLAPSGVTSLASLPAATHHPAAPPYRADRPTLLQPENRDWDAVGRS